jgi:predicted phosphodiesterase
MRDIIIGDIHGMRDELDELLFRLSPTERDTVIFVGDLIDRGPDSLGVLNTARGLQSLCQVVLVEGNHEYKHRRFRASLKKKPRDVKGPMADFTALLCPEHIAFLEAAVPCHQIPEHKAVVVHGGVLPTMRTLPTAEHLRQMSRGKRDKLLNWILRARYVLGTDLVDYTVQVTCHEDFEDDLDAAWALKAGVKIIKKKIQEKGSFIRLGHQRPEDPFWAQVYDGRFGHVYFGHEPFTESAQPVQFPHATGLDLGGVFGGHLAAAILEVGHEPRFVTVKSEKKYAEILGEN